MNCVEAWMKRRAVAAAVGWGPLKKPFSAFSASLR
jgi:hypothetical protein